jgi:hypothetical protein
LRSIYRTIYKQTADIAETNHAMNDDYYFDGNFPNAKLRPYDDYKNMSTLNTYCGILSTCHNKIKKLLSLIEFFVQVNQARWDQRLRSQNKNYIIRWLAVIYMQRLAIQFVEMHCMRTHKFFYILISIRVTIAFYL